MTSPFPLYGEDNPRAVLTARQVAYARFRRRSGERCVDIAADMKVSYTALRQAVRGATWPLVDEPPVRRPRRPNRRDRSVLTKVVRGTITGAAAAAELGVSAMTVSRWRRAIETPAIGKYRRGRVEADAVVEEIADVLIICRQLASVFGIEKVRMAIPQKLDRLAVRVAEAGPKP